MWTFLGRTPTIFMGYFKSSCHSRVLEPTLVSLWTWLLSFMRISPNQIKCLLGFSFLRFFYFMWTIKKKTKNPLLNLLQYSFCYVFCFMATRHVGSQLPDQGLNPHPLHWKVMSLPLDCWGKVLNFSYFCFLTRCEPWRETYSYSQRVFSSLFHPRFFISFAPQQQEPTEWRRNIVVLPFVHNFQGRTFPECSETTT